jgi:hypothetical protein
MRNKPMGQLGHVDECPHFFEASLAPLPLGCFGCGVTTLASGHDGVH